MPNATPTTEGKRRVLERIRAAWERCPNTPLGALIAEAVALDVPAGPLELMDDEGLAAAIEERAAHGFPRPDQLGLPLAHFPPSTTEPIDYEKLAVERAEVDRRMVEEIAAVRARHT